MEICDTNADGIDRMNNVRDVLELLTDLLAATRHPEGITLSEEGVSGLATLLLACAATLQVPME